MVSKTEKWDGEIKQYRILSDNRLVSVIREIKNEGSAKSCVAFEFAGMFGHFEAKDDSFGVFLQTFAEGLLKSVRHADIKCELSTCPGDSYYIRIRYNKILIMDPPMRTIIAEYIFNEVRLSEDQD